MKSDTLGIQPTGRVQKDHIKEEMVGSDKSGNNTDSVQNERITSVDQSVGQKPLRIQPRSSTRTNEE